MAYMDLWTGECRLTDLIQYIKGECRHCGEPCIGVRDAELRHVELCSCCISSGIPCKNTSAGHWHRNGLPVLR